MAIDWRFVVTMSVSMAGHSWVVLGSLVVPPRSIEVDASRLVEPGMQPVLARVEVGGGGAGDTLGGEPAPTWLDMGEGKVVEAPDPGATREAVEGAPEAPRDLGVQRPRGEVAPAVVDPRSDARSAVLDVVGHAASTFGSRAGDDPFGALGALARTLEPRGGGGSGWGTCGCGEMGTLGRGRGAGGYAEGTIALGSLGDRTPRPPPELHLREREEAAAPTVRMCGTVHGQECVVIPGGLGREVVRRVIRRHHDEIAACYEGALARRGDLEGVVELAMVIAPDGSVSTSSVGRSTLGDASAEGCVAVAARRWTFPSSDGITAVRWPYVMSPSGT